MVSGIVECWKIHIFPREMLQQEGVELGVGAFPAVMTGQVVIDYKGRFPAGSAMRSSRLVGFDLQNMTIHTLYSQYQLKGLGFFTNRLPGSYDLEVGQTIIQVAIRQCALSVESGEKMHGNLEVELAKRFSFFSNEVSSKDDTPNLFQAFGFECGPGWVPLLIEFGEAVESMQIDHVEISQIKEKFNSLRIYFSAAGGDADVLYKLVDDLELKSQSICEVCGKLLAEQNRQTVGIVCNHDGIGLNVITEKMLYLIENKTLN